MRILNYGRGMGKTWNIIKNASEKGLYIISYGKTGCDLIWHQANEMLEAGKITKLPPYPITLKEVEKLPSDAKVCIDELEIVLQPLLKNRQIDMISIDGESATMEVVHRCWG